METLICGACKTNNLRIPKELPLNQRQAKQVRFICDACGRKNLRDGTVPGLDIQKEEAIEITESKEEGLEDVFLIGGLATIVFALVKIVFKGK